MPESGFGEKPSVVTRFFGDVFRMPVWQKVILGIAALVGAAGVAGQVHKHLTPPATQPAAVTTVDPSLPNAHGFVGAHTQASPEAAPAAAEPSAAPSVFEQYSPAMSRVGLSFVGAFVIGWAFRVFVKAMILVTVLGVALLLGLSYFHVVNVDFSAARTKYGDSIAWITDQAVKLRDAALEHLPASGSSMVGLFVGFKKK